MHIYYYICINANILLRKVCILLVFLTYAYYDALFGKCPVLMFGAETWVLSKADELRLGVFERKILTH